MYRKILSYGGGCLVEKIWINQALAILDFILKLMLCGWGFYGADHPPCLPMHAWNAVEIVLVCWFTVVHQYC